MAMQQLDTAPPQPLSISEIKSLFPGEWVLIGNPVMDEGDLNVLSGLVLCHSFDKREIAYLWRDKVKAYDTYTLIFNRVVVPGEKRRSILPLMLRIPK